MSKEWEVNYQVPLSQSFCWHFTLCCSPSEAGGPWKRIVFGGQDLCWAFLPKEYTRDKGFGVWDGGWGGSNTGKLCSPAQKELMKPIYAFKKPMGSSSCG